MKCPKCGAEIDLSKAASALAKHRKVRNLTSAQASEMGRKSAAARNAKRLQRSRKTTGSAPNKRSATRVQSPARE